MSAGSAAEGGRRFLLDCTDFDANSQHPERGNRQEWVPLVYPDESAAIPYVLIRLPLQPERPPAADKAWRAADRVEVSFLILFLVLYGFYHTKSIFSGVLSEIFTWWPSLDSQKTVSDNSHAGKLLSYSMCQQAQ